MRSGVAADCNVYFFLSSIDCSSDHLQSVQSRVWLPRRHWVASSDRDAGKPFSGRSSLFPPDRPFFFPPLLTEKNRA